MQDILLVEDDAMTRQRLRELLAGRADARIAGSCASVREATQWLELHRPDIVLVDLGLPDGSGLEVIRCAARRHPGCDILVITVFGDAAHVVDAIEAGATGYLLKDSSLEHIGEHLSYLRLGGSPLSPRVAKLLIRRQAAAASAPVGAAAATEPVPGPISDRELEVLIGIAKGFSYVEVATALAISANTVRTHVRSLYGKLAVNSGSEAVYEYNQWRLTHGQPPLR
jgi:DNA-binding NarL/FixJ family response regulator